MLANVFILFCLHLATYFTPSHTGLLGPWSRLPPLLSPWSRPPFPGLAAMHHHNAAVAAMHRHHHQIAAMHHHQAAATAAMLNNQALGIAAAASAAPMSDAVASPYVKGGPKKPKLIIPVPGHGVVSLPVKKHVSSESESRTDSEDYLSSNESNSDVNTSESSEVRTSESSALATSESRSESEDDSKRKKNRPSSSKTPEKKPLQLPDPRKCTLIKDISTLRHPQPELPSRPRNLKITGKKKTTYKCDDDRYKGGYIVMLKTVATAETPDKKTKLDNLESADFYDMNGKPIKWEPKKNKPSSRK